MAKNNNRETGKKKSGGRREYLNDFRVNTNGEYVYMGKMYIYRQQKKSFKKAVCEIWAICIVAVAGLIVNGCIPAAGTGNCPYVILPYIASLLSFVSVCWALCRLTCAGENMREYIYNATVEKIPLRTGAAAVCAAVSFAGEIIYLALNGSDNNIIYSVLFLTFEMFSAVSSLIIKYLVSLQMWSKYP